MSTPGFYRTEGGLLPGDLLARVRARDETLPGLKPVHYGLAPGETLNEAASRSWSRLTGLWKRFADQLALRDPEDGFESATLSLWLRPLLQELGFPLPLERAVAETIGPVTFAISHRSGPLLPVHLLGAGVLLDRRTPGVRGASTVNPHGLLQDYLNRREDLVWGLLSNGLRLRLLRDNAALTRQAFVEFDLQAIFSAEDQSGFADFLLLWLTCHRTRFAPPGGGDPASPASGWIIESWRAQAVETGQRANKLLRDNVVQALNQLAPGFATHRRNPALRQALRDGVLAPAAFKRQLLRLVYRLLFLFVAEDRQALLAPGACLQTRDRFRESLSTARLRRLARRHAGTAHGDGWVQLQTLFRLLRAGAGCPALGLPALGGFLFSDASCPDLDAAELDNQHLYAALRVLTQVRDPDSGLTRRVDFEHLGAEELGSVYESLLELDFEPGTLAAGAPRFRDTAGNDRKLTGSYYTPTSLISSLLDTALQPLLDRALRQADPAAALLALKVVDPACGSGHFLVAAAHRIARALAAHRTGEYEPAPEAVRAALHEVVGRCLFGVDLNPLSVELCKVSLWLEALEPGRPLNFLESHIQCGNALLGCTPRLLREGLPDDAFKPLTGDEPAACKRLKADNQVARDLGQELFAFQTAAPGQSVHVSFASLTASLETLPQDEVAQKDALWQQAQAARDFQHATLLHDAWCAAFVLPKREGDFALDLHTGQLRQLERHPDALPPALLTAIRNLAGNAPDLPESTRETSFRFFHWHLRFPSVFRLPAPGENPHDPATGWCGGFDAVLGNPPWERVKLAEKEWFASRHPGVANAPNADARRREIESLRVSDPGMHREFTTALRRAEGESHLLRTSGAFPLCGRGDVNTYSVFAELMTRLTAPSGRAGFIVPTGIATDDGNKFFFQKQVDEQRLATLYDFENRAGLFPDVDSRVKFVLLTLTGPADPQSRAKFFFFAHGTDELADPERQIELAPADIARINPNTRTCPIFRTRRDAEITRRIYERVPVLLREARGDDQPEENPWGVRFSAMFHMSNASHLFFTRAQAEAAGWQLEANRWRKGEDLLLPLYEAKLFHHFDHRWATYIEAQLTVDPATGGPLAAEPETRDLASGEKSDPVLSIQPRYWVDERECLLVAADVPEDVTAALRKAWPGEISSEAAKRLRRELTRWLSGHRRPDGTAWVTEAELREAIALDGKKRPKPKAWEIEITDARALAQTHPLDESEADLLASLLPLPAARQIPRLWPLLHARAPRWFLAFRDIARATDERTAIFAAIPWAGVGNKAPIIYLPAKLKTFVPSLCAALSSLAFDFVARQKLGSTTLNFFYVYQFAVLPPDSFCLRTPWASNTFLADWLRPYVLELAYTAHDVRGFAEDCGHTGAPFRWDDTRRALLRAELDAAFFHLYGLNRSDTEHVLNSFTVLKNGEERRLGRYETAERVLAAYDAMAVASATGQPFPSRLNPPPADPSLAETAHPSGTAMPARLLRATVRNYRSLAGDSLPVRLDDVTVLVGPNGSGKSSFCDALAFLSDAMSGLPGALDNGEPDSRGGFASLCKAGAKTFSIRVEAREGVTDGYYEIDLVKSDNGYLISREAAAWMGRFEVSAGKWTEDGRLEGVSLAPGGQTLLLPLLQGDPRFAALAEAIARVRVYRLPPLTLRQPQNKAPTNALLDGLGRNWPTVVDRVLKGPRKGSWVVALNRLTGDIADARVKSLGGKQIVEFLHRTPGESEGGRWAPADQESDGTLRAAALLTALAQDPLPSLICIEEPELAIHPGALEILFDFIQSAARTTRVLLTTHSPDLLDHFEPDLIRVVTRDGDTTHITPMEADQYQAAKDRLRTLGDILRHETLLPGGPESP